MGAVSKAGRVYFAPVQHRPVFLCLNLYITNKHSVIVLKVTYVSRSDSSKPPLESIGCGEMPVWSSQAMSDHYPGLFRTRPKIRTAPLERTSPAALSQRNQFRRLK